jgi:hypothetical protein
MANFNFHGYFLNDRMVESNIVKRFNSRSMIDNSLNLRVKKYSDKLAKIIDIRIAMLINSDGISMGPRLTDIGLLLLSGSPTI